MTHVRIIVSAKTYMYSISFAGPMHHVVLHWLTAINQYS